VLKFEGQSERKEGEITKPPMVTGAVPVFKIDKNRLIN
jgi:hypothetical protein